ncbi:MAG: radical SAM protein [Chloroflexi bacterium]|nr:radical SAM protein [Chloroflexota bacterium]
MSEDKVTVNLGTRTRQMIPVPRFPDASAAVREKIAPVARSAEAVDVLLVNPPAPDGGIWIRSQHRVGRKSRENMYWPQVELAQMAALLAHDYKVAIIDAIGERLTWAQFEARLRTLLPKYYLTEMTAPTLQNDMYGVFLAKALGAKTMAFGTHVTPMPYETMDPFPALDFILRGEPEMTLREIVDTFESKPATDPSITKLLTDTGSQVPTKSATETNGDLSHIKGLVWRKDGKVIVNPDRPFIPNLDDLPTPMHNLLPLQKYRGPMMKGAYSFVVPSRGCSAGCIYCIKHVSYQWSLRLRSPENIMKELRLLKSLGINYFQFYADLFTLSREQVIGICKAMIAENLDMHWMSNSRVDYVDEEMLQWMAKAGCWMISWGIESGSYEILKRAHKGADPAKAERALTWARQAGIRNWGYFIIGLPGETEETIQQTMAFSKKLPLDIALFHIAAPYPGTPFFFEVVKNGWFRPGTRWEEVDMDRSTVLDYPNLRAERLEYWQKRAFREWAFRPGPILWFLRSMNTWDGIKSGLSIITQHFGWLGESSLANETGR